MCHECYRLEVVSLLKHLKDLGDLGVTMEVPSGGLVTLQSTISPYGMEVASRGP
jgi:hypothetical protein